MKQRKLIGILMCECDVLLQQRVLRGIISQAHLLDCDVAVFSTFMNVQDKSALFRTYYNIVQPQYNIFHLPDFQMFDGILYARQTFYNVPLKEELDRRLAAASVPVLVINDDKTPFPCVMSQDRVLFRRLVNHLIDAHGVREIFCLTGPAGMYPSEERRKGYRDALEEHGIAYSDENVIYGDFWNDSALQLAEELISGTRRLPQAIACGNDAMALRLCNELTDHGINVPEDILLVGYEATAEGRENLISIASYVNDAYAMGVESMCSLYARITGKPCPMPDTERGYFVPGKSCSCAEDKEILAHELRRTRRYREYETMFRFSLMAERLTACETLDQCLNLLFHMTYLIRGASGYSLCMCEDWEGGFSEDGQETYRTFGYSDTIRVKQAIGAEMEHLFDRTFPREELFPQLFALREKPCVYYFTPMQRNDRVFGYSVLSFGGETVCYDSIYPRWCDQICNALEFVRVRNYLKSINNLVRISASRDSLTGLYNKAGFAQAMQQCFTHAVETGKKLLILVASLDNLTAINDSCGRLEGDNALILFANALNKSFSGSERCGRIGGEDFAVVGCGSYEPDAAARFSNAITGYLENQCRLSELPYQPEVSFGFYCGNVPDGAAAADLYAIATEKMEEHRRSWSTERSAPYYAEFKKLRERIYSTPQEDWTIDTVCRTMILSRGYFQKLYTRCFGISFTQDVINSRINYSKRLLAETDMIIATVAMQSGYDNYVHFMHQFKKIVGITPTDYRKKKRQS